MVDKSTPRTESTSPASRAWQRMLSGRRLDLLDPAPKDIEVEDIAHGLARVARWNGQSLSSGQLAKIYGFTDLDGSQPDAWRYVPEVQDAGKPADVTGYR